MVIGFSSRMIDLGGHIVRRVPLPPPLHRIRGVMATFDDVVTRDNRRKRAPLGLATHDDLLDLLLTVTDERRPADGPHRLIRDELVTMMLAGHETTANALSWLWYLPDASTPMPTSVTSTKCAGCSTIATPTADDIDESRLDPRLPPGGDAPVPAGVGARARGRGRRRNSTDMPSRGKPP